MACSGVAPVTASTPGYENWLANDKPITTLPTPATLKMFEPKPPKNALAIKLPDNAPMNTTYNDKFAGMIIANMTADTKGAVTWLIVNVFHLALNFSFLSLMDGCGFTRIKLDTISTVKNTTNDSKILTTASNPKRYTANITTGNNAIRTSIIMRFTLVSLRIYGAVCFA